VNTRTRQHAVRSLAAAATAAGLLAGLGGCYQRVVRAKGLGADQYTISEPYQESGKVDEWLFGSPGPKNARPNNTKLPPSN
jgi:hypothetical protein